MDYSKNTPGNQKNCICQTQILPPLKVEICQEFIEKPFNNSWSILSAENGAKSGKINFVNSQNSCFHQKQQVHKTGQRNKFETEKFASNLETENNKVKPQTKALSRQFRHLSTVDQRILEANQSAKTV